MFVVKSEEFMYIIIEHFIIHHITYYHFLYFLIASNIPTLEIAINNNRQLV